MTRFLTAAAAALVCGFAYLLVTGIAMPEAATSGTMFIVSAVALLISTIAAVLSITAALRAHALHARLQHLARSVDIAFEDFVAGRKRDAATLTDMDQRLTQTVGRVEAAPDQHFESHGPAPQGDNIVPHPATMRAPPLNGPVEKEAAIADALRQAETAGTLELSLAPIVSIARGGAAGFDVLAHLRPESGPALDLRRITPLSDGPDLAAIECLLVLGAVDVARRPGAEAGSTLLHVAISRALLGDREELARVFDALNRHPGIARSIVLSLPVETIENPGASATMLARLAATGLRFSAEGWPDSEKAVEALWRAGTSFLRMPAAKVLAGNSDPDEMETGALLDMLVATGMTAIATEVASDADAAALAEIGISLTAGTNSSGTGALRPEGGASPRRPGLTLI